MLPLYRSFHSCVFKACPAVPMSQVYRQHLRCTCLKAVQLERQSASSSSCWRSRLPLTCITPCMLFRCITPCMLCVRDTPRMCTHQSVSCVTLCHQRSLCAAPVAGPTRTPSSSGSPRSTLRPLPAAAQTRAPPRLKGSLASHFSGRYQKMH